MIILRHKYFTGETWATKKPRSFLGWLVGRDGFSQWNRVKEYNKATGQRTKKWMLPFGSRWRDFKNWQQEKYGNVIHQNILF